MGPDRVRLKDHSDRPFIRRHERRPRCHDVVADRNLASIRTLEARDATERRAFATAAGPEQRVKFPGGDFKVHPLKGIDTPIHCLKALCQAGYLDAHKSPLNSAARSRAR